jgi:hypothetical protein
MPIRTMLPSQLMGYAPNGQKSRGVLTAGWSGNRHSIECLTAASEEQRLQSVVCPVANSVEHGRVQFLPQSSTEQFWLESLVMAANKSVGVTGESLLLVVLVVLFVWAVVKLVGSLSR